VNATVHVTPAATVRVATSRAIRWPIIKDGDAELALWLGEAPEDIIAACDRLSAALVECRETAVRRLAAGGSAYIHLNTTIAAAVGQTNTVTYRWPEPPITESEQRALAGDR